MGIDNVLIVSVAIPVTFMALIFTSGTALSQMRMCVYVVISSLAIMADADRDSKPFALLSMIIIFLAIMLICKLARQKDVSDD